MTIDQDNKDDDVNDVDKDRDNEYDHDHGGEHDPDRDHDEDHDHEHGHDTITNMITNLIKITNMFMITIVITLIAISSRQHLWHLFQGSLIVQVQAVDGDAGVGNAVTYEIISGKCDSVYLHMHERTCGKSYNLGENVTKIFILEEAYL